MNECPLNELLSYQIWCLWQYPHTGAPDAFDIMQQLLVHHSYSEYEYSGSHKHTLTVFV